MSHALSTQFSGCIFFHMHRIKIFCQIFPDIAQQYFASAKWCLRGSLYSFYPYFTPTLNILSFGLFSLAICCTCTKYFQFSVNLEKFCFSPTIQIPLSSSQLKKQKMPKLYVKSLGLVCCSFVAFAISRVQPIMGANMNQGNWPTQNN